MTETTPAQPTVAQPGTPATPTTEPTSTPTQGSQPETNAVSGVFAEKPVAPAEAAPPQETPPTHAPAPAQPVTPPEPVVAAEPVSTTVPPEPVEAAPPAEPPQPERVVPKPEEYVIPEGVDPALRQFAHEQGYTQQQLDGTLQRFGGYIQNMKAAEQAQMRTMGEEHLKTWGPAAETKLALAKRALKQNDPEGKLAEQLELSGFGSHPAVLDFLHTIGKSMQEGGFLRGAVKRPAGKQTAAQALFGETHASAEQ